MGHIISFGMGKGGVGKTSTCAIISDLLANAGYKVLAIDFDSQGNLTQMITRKSLFDFEERTILEALKEKNALPYIHAISDNFHLIPADDFLAYLSKYIYRDYSGNPMTLLAETIQPLKDAYDFITIDLPPNLGDHTLNGLAASDFSIAVFQPEPFCYDGLLRYEETVELVQEQINQNMNFLGVIVSMMDSIATIDEAIYQKACKQFGEKMFTTVIKRRVRIKEFSITGIQKAVTRDQATLQPYISLVKELLDRVKVKAKAI
ncbi:ParA family protein [Thermoactinomyces sp. DSM 45892]|uniref:ParA family protein n=1 Tax=Thermoactinomyces sp. DSM 45892 TaxID=1882753 RepID=UPI00089B7980|nr:ParA family protein [Thermoactinomyces sp. DSM 45892]SDY83121.1 chromosome partitioning protein [Thermoactinomyces sp. DSM 45892]